MPKPTVGRIVHFYSKIPRMQWNNAGEGPYAAIITHVNSDGSVNLFVFGNCQIMPEYKELAVPEGNGQYQACWWCWPPME
jgi:hypothetical protein